MSEQLFDIYFRGEILDGFTPAQSHQNIAQLFKASPEKVQQLFSGKVVALKKRLDKNTALKFQQALKNAGVKIYIKQAQTPAPATQSQTASTTTAPAAAIVQIPKNKQDSSESHDELIILPPGSDVLTEDEREHIVIPDIDISNIHLTSAFSTPTNEPTTPAPAAPDVSHITAAAVGADILEGVVKEVEKTAPDTSHIHLGNVGEDLLPTREEVVIAAPDTSSIKLAEVGADIDPTQKKIPPPAPDTNHIQLEP